MVRNGFTRKKVGSLTLGEKLKKIRSEYRISLNEVCKNTKIQVKYLEYLENGEYEKLPPDVYARGFVRSYAHFLGADENVLIKLYERERNIQKNLKKERFQEGSIRKFSFPSFVVTPRVFMGGAVFLLVFGGFLYLYREFRSFAAAPYLVIVEPADGQVIEGSEAFVRGRTDRDVKLSINNQPTFVKEDGSFLERVSLQPGSNTLTVTALNKFDKEEKRTVTVQASYEASVAELPVAHAAEPTAAPGVRLEMTVEGKPTRISIESDGVVIYSGVLAPDAKQTFEAKSMMRVSSEDGGRTVVRVNDGEPKVLGGQGEAVKDAVFSAEDQEARSPGDSAANR
jgi:cytoskeletal protein RodZ